MSTLRVSTIQDTAGSNSSTPAAIANGIAKAWITFNATNSTIRASYNISSLTKNGTGDFTLSFTNAMADTNYCTAGSAGVAMNVEPAGLCGYTNTNTSLGITRSTTQVRMGTCSVTTGAPASDRDYGCFVVFR